MSEPTAALQADRASSANDVIQAQLALACVGRSESDFAVRCAEQIARPM